MAETINEQKNNLASFLRDLVVLYAQMITDPRFKQAYDLQARVNVYNNFIKSRNEAVAFFKRSSEAIVGTIKDVVDELGLDEQIEIFSKWRLADSYKFDLE